jgi:dephospho-CoA kinase
MRIIGLLGGVASGKSFVARQFESLGAGVLDADRAAHEVLRMPEIEAAAQERWGPEVLDCRGRIDRSRLARIVFGPRGATEREYLEKLTHPRIQQLVRRQAEALAEAGHPVAVVDAPLLLEAGWDAFCDALIYIDTPRPSRLARALERGWKEEEFTAREDAQESLDVKRARADMIVDNSGSAEQTRAQIERYWHALVG